MIKQSYWSLKKLPMPKTKKNKKKQQQQQQQQNDDKKLYSLSDKSFSL